MKLLKISSAFLASCIFETIIAVQYFKCKHDTFTLDYVTRTANAARQMEMYSVHRFPKPYDLTGKSKSQDIYRQFPLSTSGEIWTGEI
ncbi:unnamed protein product [Blumeria hordei]|uniref:Uncharacterized protein n=1 Tax=Blumeria hordei TaxID=2867405 RepID=A0A383UMY1_BLUHO|nr:unnamed protein product [Blumeria hordei]